MSNIICTCIAATTRSCFHEMATMQTWRIKHAERLSGKLIRKWQSTICTYIYFGYQCNLWCNHCTLFIQTPYIFAPVFRWDAQKFCSYTVSQKRHSYSRYSFNICINRFWYFWHKCCWESKQSNGSLPSHLVSALPGKLWICSLATVLLPELIQIGLRTSEIIAHNTGVVFVTRVYM